MMVAKQEDPRERRESIQHPDLGVRLMMASNKEQSGACRCNCGGSCSRTGEPLMNEESLLRVFARRMPWLIVLMLLQSISSFVLQRYEKLIEENAIIAAYLTMLVGGGGNAAVQVVTDLVRQQTRAKHDTTGVYTAPPFWGTLRREGLLSLMAACTLAAVAYPRVRYLSIGSPPSTLDAVAICTSCKCPGATSGYC